MPGVAAVLLARAQFALTVGFHIVLPAFSIGLASYLAVLEILWLRDSLAGVSRCLSVLAEGIRRHVSAWASCPAS